MTPSALQICTPSLCYYPHMGILSSLNLTCLKITRLPRHLLLHLHVSLDWRQLSFSMPNASNHLAQLHPHHFPSGEGEVPGPGRSGSMPTSPAHLTLLTLDALETRIKIHRISLNCRWDKVCEALSPGLACRKAPGQSWPCGRLPKHSLYTTAVTVYILAIVCCTYFSVFVCVHMHAVTCIRVHMWRSGGNFQESVLSSIKWAPGAELRPSALAASAFPRWAISAALQLPLKWAQCRTSTTSILFDC